MTSGPGAAPRGRGHPGGGGASTGGRTAHPPSASGSQGQSATTARHRQVQVGVGAYRAGDCALATQRRVCVLGGHLARGECRAPREDARVLWWPRPGEDKAPALPVLAPAPSGPGLRCQHLLLDDSQGCGSPISHPFQHPTKGLPEGRVALCQPQAGLGDSSLRLSMPGACSRSEPLYCHPDRPCCPVREWACCPQHRVLVDQRAAGGYRCVPDDAATPLLGSDRFCTHKPLHADIARPSLGGQLGGCTSSCGLHR